MRLTTASVLAALVLPISLTVPWAEAEQSLLRCHAKDYVALARDGSLKEKDRKYWLDVYSNFIVDVSTGAIRFNNEKAPVIWQVIQRGDSSNDSILTPMDRASAPIASDFLRIRGWVAGVQVHFFMVSLTKVITGVCLPVE